MTETTSANPSPMLFTSFDPAVKDAYVTFPNRKGMYLPEISRPSRAVGALSVIVTVAVAAYFSIVFSGALVDGNWVHFAQNTQHVFTSMTLQDILITTGVGVVLIGGTIYVVRKALGPQPLIGDPTKTITSGKFSGDDHYLPALLLWTPRDHSHGTINSCCNKVEGFLGRTSQRLNNCLSRENKPVEVKVIEKEIFMPAYIDVSTLDKNAEGLYSGTAYGYKQTEYMEHVKICLKLLMLSPLYIAATLVANLAFAILSPFYVLGGLAYEAAKGQIDEERAFEWQDIVTEPYYALQRMAGDVFYGVGMMFAALYAEFEPHNGRKFGSIVERAWNNFVPRHESIWLHGGYIGPKFKWIRGAYTLRRIGFYGPGCWQPQFIVEVEANVIKRAYNPSGSRDFTHVEPEKNEKGNWVYKSRPIVYCQ